MGTTIRPETTKANQYWVSKHRYYELLHWCRQYEEWVKNRCIILSDMPRPSTNVNNRIKKQESYIEKAVEYLERYNKKISILENTAKEAAPDIYEYLILSVTRGRGYTYLKQGKDIPCSKNYFYDKYRKFFWLLDQKLD